jgi:large subunit ribosomal protein L30
MICIIRIKGRVGINRNIEETFKRLGLRKKYSCVVIKPTKEKLGMVKKLRNFVAYGELNLEMFEKLVEKRGQPINKNQKINAKEIVKKLENGESYEKLNLKPFFRLHPARGGIDSKLHFGKKKGVLGNNKEAINKLVERML